MLSSNKAIVTAAEPNGPWNSPLLMAWSQDGRVFATTTTFQDSSGLWFREPRTAPTWDRIAVKFYYDVGRTWTETAAFGSTSVPATACPLAA